MDLLDNKELADELKKIASAVFGFTNQLAVAEKVKKVLDFMQHVKPATYERLWRSIWNESAMVKDYETIMPIEERLERLAIRLQDDGFYVDSEICWLALERLKKEA